MHGSSHKSCHHKTLFKCQGDTPGHLDIRSTHLATWGFTQFTEPPRYVLDPTNKAGSLFDPPNLIGLCSTHLVTWVSARHTWPPGSLLDTLDHMGLCSTHLMGLCSTHLTTWVSARHTWPWVSARHTWPWVSARHTWPHGSLLDTPGHFFSSTNPATWVPWSYWRGAWMSLITYAITTRGEPLSLSPRQPDPTRSVCKSPIHQTNYY